MERRNFLKGFAGSIISGAVILSQPTLLQGELVDKIIKPSTDIIVPEKKQIILATENNIEQLSFSGWMYANAWSVSMNQDTIGIPTYDNSFATMNGLGSIEIDIHGVMDGVTYINWQSGMIHGRNQKMHISF